MIGRPTSYKSEFCEIAYKLLSQEHSVGVAQVASELNVTERTILNWRKSHVEFADAVERGLAAGKTLLLKEARRNTISDPKMSVYNTPLFSRLMQSIYKDSENSTVNIDGWDQAKTIKEKLDLVVKHVGNGEITPEQANKVADVLAKHVQLTELADIKARLEALEGSK